MESAIVITTPKAGFLLAASCVAAIAAVGSIFELSSGHPQYGVWFTGIVLTLSVPLGGFFFFAAVREAKENQ